MKDFEFKPVLHKLLTPSETALSLKLKRNFRPEGDPEALLFFTEGLELSRFPEIVFFLGQSPAALECFKRSPADAQRILERDLTGTVLPTAIQIWSFIRKDELPLSKVIWETELNLSFGKAIMRFVAGEELCTSESALYGLLLTIPAVFATVMFTGAG